MKILMSGALLCSMSCMGYAQVTAQIHGTVKDASGAAVPGAEVKATNTGTGVSRTVTSEADGGYIFANLATGPYQIEVTKPGFSKAVESGIVLQVNSDPLVEIALKVGTVSEQVNVEANASQVETRSSAVSTVVENQRIVELPLNGRNVTDLISLAGAAVQVGSARAAMGTGIYATPVLQVGGSLGFATAYSLDGANYLNPSSGGTWPMPFPDALQEFKVDASGAAANQGKSSAVSAVTKGGTNQFHGDVFEFLRNDATNGHLYFSPKALTQKRNQFGGTAGGAIKKDKIFYFGAFQETMFRQDPGDNEAWLPTAQMLNGDWTTFASPACGNVTGGQLRGGFTNNRISPANFNKTGLQLVKTVLASAPTPDPCGHIYYDRPLKANEYQGVGRMDYQLTDKHTLFGRYQNLYVSQPNAFDLTPNNILNAAAAGLDNEIQNAAIGSTYVFGPTTVNSFRFSGNFSRARAPGVDTFSMCDFQAAAGVPINYYCGNAPHRSNITIVNGFTFASGEFPFIGFNNTLFAVGDEVGLIRGSHQMAIGFNGDVSRNTANYHALDNNKFTFTGQCTGHGLGDVLTGCYGQMINTAQNHFDITSLNPSLYFADTWKARQRLTVTMSVRWDPFIPQSLKHSGIANFDFARFNAGITTKQYPFGPAGWYYPGDPGTPGWRGTNSRLAHFSPRLGLAWDPTGSGRTSIRASYAYSYSPVLNYWRQDPEDQNPWSNATRAPNVGVQNALDNPWQGYSFVDPVSGRLVTGNPFPSVMGRGFTQDGDYTSTPFDINVPQSSSWNLSLQRQVGVNWLFSASYLGNMTTHIWLQEQPNAGQIVGPVSTTCPANAPATQCSGTANLAQRRLFTLLRPNDLIRQGAVALLYSGGNMSYNALLVSAQKRVSKGTSLQFNYTWSHCLSDMIDAIASGPDAGEVSTIPYNRHNDYGNCDADRRHVFNLTGVAKTPQFSGRALRMVASDWQLAGLYRWSAGQPMLLLAGSDRALHGDLSFFSGTTFQRGNQVLPNDQMYAVEGTGYANGTRTGGSGPFQQYLNPAAFAVPALGTVGNSHRNNATFVPIWQFDLALLRAFPINESQRVELRVEAFNVLNKFRPSGTPTTFAPNATSLTNVSNGFFGQIRAALDPRIMQFALKYVF